VLYGILAEDYEGTSRPNVKNPQGGRLTERTVMGHRMRGGPRLLKRRAGLGGRGGPEKKGTDVESPTMHTAWPPNDHLGSE